MSTMLNPSKSTNKGTKRPRILLYAAAAGAVASLLVYVYLSKQASSGSSQAAAPAISVVVAGRDIPARTLVTNAMLQIRALPAAQVPRDGVTALPDVEGKVALSPIAAGQPVTQSLVAVRGVEMGLAYAVPAGMRAVTVALDPVSGVAGFIKPGDHVDVLTTFDEGNGRSATRTALQNVTLLATGALVLPSHAPEDRGVLNNNGIAAPAETPTPKPQEIPNATVAVTPDDAQKLVLAASRGKLQLALRPADDQNRTDLPVLNSTVITGPVTAPAAAPAPRAAAPTPALLPAAPSPHAAAPATVSLPVPPPPAARPLPVPPTIMVIKGSDTKMVTVGH